MRISPKVKARIAVACIVISSLLVLAVVIAALAGRALDGDGISAIVFGGIAVIAGIRTYRIYRGRS